MIPGFVTRYLIFFALSVSSLCCVAQMDDTRIIPTLRLPSNIKISTPIVPEVFSLNVGHEMQVDDNIFRLSRAAAAAGGPLDATEHINRSSIGFQVNKKLSLQQFEVNANLIDSHYDKFSYLNFMARNASATWRWSVTPQLYGVLSSARKESLNDFADNQVFNLRNERTQTNTIADFTYELGADWQVGSGLSNAKQINVLPLAAEGNTSTNSGNLGLRYIAKSGNSVSYVFKETHGQYTNRIISNTDLLDSSFREHAQEIRVKWAVDGKSSLSLSSAYVVRSHPNFEQRDYNGFNGGLNFDWAATGKIAVNMRLARQLSSYQTATTNISQTNSFILTPIWRVGNKTVLRATLDFSRREYRDSPSGVLSSERKDTVRDLSFAVDWEPYRNMTLNTTVRRAERNSNQLGLDYRANIISIGAQYEF